LVGLTSVIEVVAPGGIGFLGLFLAVVVIPAFDSFGSAIPPPLAAVAGRYDNDLLLLD